MNRFEKKQKWEPMPYSLRRRIHWIYSQRLFPKDYPVWEDESTGSMHITPNQIRETYLEIAERN
jgi:hypothetical protein